MCQNNNNTKSRKGKHLEYIERQSIERWYNRERKSKAEIARLLERDEKTIRNEIKKGLVNSISMLENCETSAIGRALGFCGFGIDNGIASGQDMNKVEQFKQRNRKEEIYNNIFISYDEAVKIVKTAINELCRKQGIVVSDLSLKINQEIWCSLEELNLQQLKRLEYELSKINNKTHKWHELYNQNSKIKIVVPENQEVVYKSSHYMFGQEALKQAGDDELLKGQIIDSYLELGTDLTKVIE